MKLIGKIRTCIHWLEESFLCLLLMAMIILACAQIILRDFFASGFPWGEPLLRLMVLWAGMFGAAVATRQGKHIAIDVASRFLPEQLRQVMQILLDLFSALVCLGLTYAACLFIRSESSFGGAGVFDIASWKLYLVFPITFALISVRFFFTALLNAGTMFKGIMTPAAEEPGK